MQGKLKMQGSIDSAKRVEQGSWEARSGMGAQLWNRLGLHPKVSHLSMCISYWSILISCHGRWQRSPQLMTLIFAIQITAPSSWQTERFTNRKMDLIHSGCPF